MPTKTLWPKQVEDLGFAIANPKSINRSEPGCGKTGTACMMAYYHWIKRQKKTVWAMPLSLMEKNKNEMLAFTDFSEDDVAILESDHKALAKSWTGPTKMRNRRVRTLRIKPRTTAYHYLEANPGGRLSYSQEILDDEGLVSGWNHFEVGKTGKAKLLPVEPGPEFTQVEPIKGPDGQPAYMMVDVPEETADLIAASGAKVFIVSFAFLREHWAHMLKVHPDIDVFMTDEHHLGYKKPESQQTESFYFVNQHCSVFYPMTGSLIDGSLETAFPVIHVIEPRYYGSYAGFLNEHAALLDDRGRVILWQNEEKVRAILERHSVCRTFTEMYGEEDVVFFHQKVEVGALCREQYDLFHKQAMLELESGEFLDGTQPGVAVIRARQILGHPETMGLAKGEETGKDQMMRVFAAEGQPMLVFAALKPEQERLQRLLTDCGLRTALINSDVNFRKRNEIDLAFREGHLDAIVASGPTAGVGWNWERADHVVYASVDYLDTNFIQAYRRASRGTRTRTLRVTSLEYRDTIERRVYEILTYKSELANKIESNRRVLRFSA